MGEVDEQDSRYAWLIVAVSACSMVFTWGTTFSFGIFIAPLSTEFGYTPVQLSTAFSVELLAFYGLAGVMGILISKVTIRPTVIGLSILLAIDAILFLYVSSYIGLVVLFSLMGTILGTMFVVLVSIIPQWFDAREGLAMGIIFAGNGFGMQVMPPIWERAIASFGVRTSFLWITLLTAAVFLVTGLIVRRPRTVSGERNFDSAGLTEWLVTLLKSRKFWLAFIGAGLLFAWYYMLSTHAVNLFTSRGMGREIAATLFGLIGGVSIIFRLGGGYIADRFGTRSTIVVATVVSAIGFFLIISESLLLTYTAIVFFGVGLGTNATLYVPALMQSFEPERETAFVGVFNFVYAGFAFLMPLTSSIVVNVAGGYTIPFLSMGVLTLTGAVLFWFGTR